MKVIVTGAGGQLGAALLANAPDNWIVEGLTRRELDLADSQAITALVKARRPDFVINAGAYTAVDKAESEPDLVRTVNEGAPAAFAKALREYGGRLIQISTDFVFDGDTSTPYTPNAERNPLSIYGQTKADGEDAAGTESIILRTSWVYAAGGGNFVRTMLRLMAKRDTLSVVSDQIGAPSWAPEIARTIWELTDANKPGIYHHRDKGETSWHGFAEAIAREAMEIGLIKHAPEMTAIPTEQYPTPAKRPAYSVLDDTKTRTLLGDETRDWLTNLRTMLKEEKALG